jgi:Domain of unknown function (DUF4386)
VPTAKGVTTALTAIFTVVVRSTKFERSVVRTLQKPCIEISLDKELAMITNKLGETEMIQHNTDIPQSQAAIVVGLGLLIMAIAAFFANFFVLETLVVPEDAAKTVSNIMENQMLFRFSIAGFVVVLLCDVLVAWALYVFLKPVNQSLSMLAAIFRLVYTAIFAAALFNLANAFQLVSGAEQLSVFTAEQLQAQVMMSLESFQYGWLIALVFFGFHLLVLGYVVMKSVYVPKVLGVLLLVAGFAYIVDSFAHFLLPNYADYKTLFLLIVAVPGILG